MKKYRLARPDPHRFGRWEYTLQRDGSICLHSFNGCRPQLNIPDMLLGRPVTALGRMFHGPRYAVVICLPETVTSIGPYAFSDEEDLQAVWIPSSVTNIHETAFANSPGVTLFVEESSAAHDFARGMGLSCCVEEIPCMEEDDSYFTSGDWLCAEGEDGIVLCEYNGTQERLVIPDTVEGTPVTLIAPDCCHGNDFLTEVTVPEGVDVIGSHAFAECVSLRRAHLPDTLVRMDPGCFAECHDLAEVRLSPQMEIIQMSAFYGCKALKRITLPDSVREIDPLAFAGCASLEEIRLSENLQTVMRGAFYGCSRLRRPRLPETLDAESREVFEKLGS